MPPPSLLLRAHSRLSIRSSSFKCLEEMREGKARAGKSPFHNFFSLLGKSPATPLKKKLGSSPPSPPPSPTDPGSCLNLKGGKEAIVFFFHPTSFQPHIRERVRETKNTKQSTTFFFATIKRRRRLKNDGTKKKLFNLFASTRHFPFCRRGACIFYFALACPSCRERKRERGERESRNLENPSAETGN